MIPPITDYLNKGTNHSEESNILLSLRPIVKYPRIKFWFRLSAQVSKKFCGFCSFYSAFWKKILKRKSSGKGGVHSFVNELVRLKIIHETYQWNYCFDWLMGCSIFTCALLIFFLNF